ncbi:hypothetical protein [Aquimarina sp. AU119]|uniref:hypothetical protein n=1 Tax=Aquimarina sp. AU119 TaxID=2108528 RepID=UPI000D69E01C|nr:hypothetical protein [Aquimarina sp. AU119]
MKKIALLLLFLPVLGLSQHYHSEVALVLGRNAKLKTDIIVKDSIIEITSYIKDKPSTLTFDIVKKVHGGKQIYFTDGVKTHSFSYGEMENKVKGFKYTHVVNVTYEQVQGSIQTVYYSVIKP